MSFSSDQIPEWRDANVHLDWAWMKPEHLGQIAPVFCSGFEKQMKDKSAVNTVAVIEVFALNIVPDLASEATLCFYFGP